MANPSVLLQCQAALRELGLPVPLSAASAEDTTAQQTFGLWNGLGEELFEKYKWKELEKSFEFDTIEGQSRYPLPADWAGPITQTEWDKSNHWSMVGQATSQQWQALQSGVVQLGPRLRYRYIDDSIEIFPTPTSVGGTFTPYHLGFFYIANGWVIRADGSTASYATSDADVAVYPNRLMVNGIKLKLWEVKGFDTSALTKDYDGSFNQAMSRNQGAPRLSLSPRVAPIWIGVGNIPDGNWPTGIVP